MYMYVVTSTGNYLFSVLLYHVCVSISVIPLINSFFLLLNRNRTQVNTLLQIIHN